MAKQEYKERIVVRKNLDFGLTSDEIPTYWLDGNAYKTRVVDAVQAAFPDGERYFIAAVRAFRDRLKDPAMIQDVKDFMMQEGQHGMVHTRYNDRLRRQGIHIDGFTKHTKRVTEMRLKRYSPEYNVAFTAALEHFTAMMAELFFAEKAVLEGADKNIRAMLAWHAVEEMEHKAVAFDVMQKVAKVGYFKRTAAMTHAGLSFSLFTMVSPWYMLGMDGLSRRQRLKLYLKNGGWMMHPRKGIFPRMLPLLASYYKPGFHPNDLPSVHNYDEWVSRYAEDRDPVAASEAMYAAAA